MSQAGSDRVCPVRTGCQHEQERHRYTRGVLADPTTQEPGRAAAKLTSRLVPIVTANNRTSPVGVQFPQPRVTTRDASDALLDDVVGNWWSVLVWGNDPTDLLSETELGKLEALGARLVAIVPENQREWTERSADPRVLVLGDHTGRFKEWFDDRPTPIVFLRPDRFVAGACLAQHAPATLDAILESMHFTGRPASDRTRPELAQAGL